MSGQSIRVALYRPTAVALAGRTDGAVDPESRPLERRNPRGERPHVHSGDPVPASAGGDDTAVVAHPPSLVPA
jgi:hypothetical protein